MVIKSMLFVGIFILVLNCERILAKTHSCDHLGTLLYEDLGCTPVTRPESKCPVKYDCNLDVKNGSCLYRGRQIPIGESIPNDDTYKSCEVGCACTSQDQQKSETKSKDPKTAPGQFVCGVLDCPEWSGVLNNSCHRTYNLNKCCSTGQMCASEENKIGECLVDGTKVLEGERFYPKDTCSSCICHKEWNGKFDLPYCVRPKCNVQIRRSAEIRQFCAPFYVATKNESLCCPNLWVCPTSEDEIVTLNPDADKSSDLTCQFGTKSLKLGEGLRTKVNNFDDSVVSTSCECILPPFLTCKGAP